MLVFKWLSPDQDARLGNMGQLLEGTVGGIWALAGVLLVFEALKFQRLELKSQRHEFELNRQEIVEQTQLLRAQNQTMFLQTFESTFFNLLNLHDEIVDSIHLEIITHNDKVPIQSSLGGRKCFVEFYNIFKHIYYENIDLTGLASPSINEMRELINESYSTFYSKHQDDLGHYLRNIHNIVAYVDKSEFKNKIFYINLVHDHLSNFELVLLFYYCISEEGVKLKPFIEKYHILENIPTDELLDRRHKDLFSMSAF
jgi:hypothetical protein